MTWGVSVSVDTELNVEEDPLEVLVAELISTDEYAVSGAVAANTDATISKPLDARPSTRDLRLGFMVRGCD
jgi:hypothetical protein